MGRLIAFLLFIPLNILVVGFTFSILWGWFVAPIFGLPKLPLLSAFGFSMVWNYLSHSSGATESVSRAYATLLGKAVLFLAVGAIVHTLL